MATHIHDAEMKGTCKFWDVGKGFGFITPADGGKEIYCHFSDLTVEGERYQALVPDSVCAFTYNEKGQAEDGRPRAASVTAEDGTPLPGFVSKVEAEVAINLALRRRKVPDLQTGKLKWFDTSKGYGFIVPDAGGEDVFVRLSQVVGGVAPMTDDPVEYTVQTVGGDEEGGEKKIEALSVINHKPAPIQRIELGGYPYTAMPQGIAGPPAPTSMPGALTGTVKFFSLEKGFGFVIPTAGGPEVHFSTTGIKFGQSVTTGDAVEYQVNSEGDKTWATNLGKPGGGDYFQTATAATMGYPGQPAAAAYGQQVAYGQQAYAAAAAAGVTPGREGGVVKFFNEKSGFGFIIPATGGKEVHFSRKNVSPGQHLQTGDQVEYDIRTRDDKVWATAVGKSGALVAHPQAYLGVGLGLQAQPPAPLYHEEQLQQPQAQVYHGAYDTAQAAQVAPAYGETYGETYHPYGDAAFGQDAANANAWVTPGRVAGQVKFFNEEKGFGFVIPSDGSKEIHFSGKSVRGARTLQTGDTVEYDVQNKEGKTWARDVTLLTSAGQQSLGKRKTAAPSYGEAAVGYSPFDNLDKKPMLAHGGEAYNPYGVADAYGVGVGGQPTGFAAARESGQVKFFNEEREFGFVVPSTGGKEVHFSRKNITGGGSVTAGDSVEFDREERFGKIWATNVTKVAPGGQQPFVQPTPPSNPPPSFAEAYGEAYDPYRDSQASAPTGYR